MIAERHAIGAMREQFVADRFRDAEATGGVLAVDDDEIGAQARPQVRQMPLDRGAAGTADDVADEKESA